MDNQESYGSVLFSNYVAKNSSYQKTPDAVIRNHNHMSSEALDDIKLGITAERRQRICLTGVATRLFYRYIHTK